MRAHWQLGRVLSTMQPYTDVICCVLPGARRLGLARSDPYLSTAHTLADVKGGTPRQLVTRMRDALAGVSVGALLLALPQQQNLSAVGRRHGGSFSRRA